MCASIPGALCVRFKILTNHPLLKKYLQGQLLTTLLHVTLLAPIPLLLPHPLEEITMMLQEVMELALCTPLAENELEFKSTLSPS